ncbi:serine hydrolase [Roseivirga sp.]|uniref:serine hydrolase n=1 Tax=Roseivirga sp. TaxID=1964215 RepID=UPI003B8BD24F
MRLLLVFLCISFTTNGALSQSMSPNILGLDQQIDSIMNTYNSVGLSVAVVFKDEVIYAKGFGYRDLEAKLSVSTNTVFQLGSMTKAFTGALIGILESEGKLSLNDRPANHLPDFNFYNRKMDELITIDDLLSHKSGIGNQGTTEVFFPEKDLLSVAHRLRHLPPQAEVKNSFSYSNMAFSLAGTIIEQTSGKSWEAYNKIKLFQPLEMSSTFTEISQMKATRNFALGYGRQEGKTKLVAYEKYNSIRPAGAIKSTVLDLANWMRVWLNKGQLNDKQIIPESYVNQATQLQNTKREEYAEGAFLMGEGFGWRLRAYEGHFRVRHGGNTFGFSTNLDMFPHQELGIVVLTNQDHSLLPYIICDLISRRILGLNPIDEYPIVITDLYKPNLDKKPINKEKKPNRPIQDFVGQYAAKGYGTIEVIYEDDELFALLPSYKFRLQHMHYNTFDIRVTQDFKDSYSPEFSVKFTDNLSGEITTLELFSQNEPIQFIKK